MCTCLRIAICGGGDVFLVGVDVVHDGSLAEFRGGHFLADLHRPLCCGNSVVREFRYGSGREAKQ